ncbi:hypothetical protein [Aliivibrio fischeri]|uniref:hypothetical protein n=1 Tax=Aliivibrio fischeri TaxID=668 RepID=UPI003F777103
MTTKLEQLKQKQSALLARIKLSFQKTKERKEETRMKIFSGSNDLFEEMKEYNNERGAKISVNIT